MITRYLAALVVIALLPISSGHANSKVIKITGAEAKCIVENMETYNSYGTDPIIIVLETCREKTPVNSGNTGLRQTNSTLGLPTPKVGKGDKILILLRSQLACVSEIIGNSSLPDSDTELVEISLDRCDS